MYLLKRGIISLHFVATMLITLLEHVLILTIFLMTENWSQMNSERKINNKFWENASHQFLQNGFDIHWKLLRTCDLILWVRLASSAQSCLYRRLSGWRIWSGTKDTDIVEQYSLNEQYPPATIFATCLKSTTGLTL